jgi:hypothetical protein
MAGAACHCALIHVPGDSSEPNNCKEVLGGPASQRNVPGLFSIPPIFTSEYCYKHSTQYFISKTNIPGLYLKGKYS